MSAAALSRETDPDIALLLAVRLRSRGTTDAVGETWWGLASGPVPNVDEALHAAAARGRVRARGEEPRWSLTPAGAAELATRLAHETDAVGRAELAAAYEDFLPHNRDFLAVCVAWSDGLATVADVAGLVDEVVPILDSLVERLARFEGYRDRFAAALSRADSDGRWVDDPGLDSVHTIWFELHEHLLATLGRDRTQER